METCSTVGLLKASRFEAQIQSLEFVSHMPLSRRDSLPYNGVTSPQQPRSRLLCRRNGTPCVREPSETSAGREPSWDSSSPPPGRQLAMGSEIPQETTIPNGYVGFIFLWCRDKGSPPRCCRITLFFLMEIAWGEWMARVLFARPTNHSVPPANGTHHRLRPAAAWWSQLR
jgi:hypothetical protein